MDYTFTKEQRDMFDRISKVGKQIEYINYNISCLSDEDIDKIYNMIRELVNNG